MEAAPKLLDRVRDRIRAKHYSLRTERAYLQWIRRFIVFNDKKHPSEMSAPEVERFLTYLAVEAHVAAATQNQAEVALLALCAAYVFGCAFRSVLPRADVQRIVLFDTWLSPVLVGRSVATIAELCFMAQAALYLRVARRASGHSGLRSPSSSRSAARAGARPPKGIRRWGERAPK